MTSNLFPPPDPEEEASARTEAPLADRMRPRLLEEVAGQGHLLQDGKFLSTVIQADQVPSLILWGPPGVGKTSLARIIAESTQSEFIAISAVLSGIKDVKRVVEEARRLKRTSGRHTILFVDEIHRFNKSQQDAFLPHVENGTITLIGATTENPSFEVIGPLLSRCRVLVLHPLQESDLLALLKRALADGERGLGEWKLSIAEASLAIIARRAGGDARKALTTLEIAAQMARRENSATAQIQVEHIREALQAPALVYDKEGEEHYNLISALHKSLRNSDVDASLYWLARMVEAGEDPLYIARRMVRFASEDVGLADPWALGLALDAMETIRFVGLPEGALALAQLAVYLCQAPKSNSIYRAFDQTTSEVRRSGALPVPLHLRNAPTRLMKNLGYGRGYRYAHDEQEGVANMECLPDKLTGRRFFHAGDSGFEKKVKERLEEIRKSLQARRLEPPSGHSS